MEKLSKAEREVLKHMRRGWGGLINKRTFYVSFFRGTMQKGKTWVPPGPTGATVAKLMGKGIIDFEPRSKGIAKLVFRAGRK